VVVVMVACKKSHLLFSENSFHKMRGVWYVVCGAVGGVRLNILQALVLRRGARVIGVDGIWTIHPTGRVWWQNIISQVVTRSIEWCSYSIQY
jgi:hypothetical protein